MRTAVRYMLASSKPRLDSRMADKERKNKMKTAEECLDVIADAYNCPDVAITEAIQMILDEAVAHGMTISAEIVGKDAIIEQQTACWSVLAERKKLLLTARDKKVWRKTK